MKNYEQNFLEKSKNTLNEMSSENVIYDEIQIGPQEEPIIYEFPINIRKYRQYVNKISKKNSFR